MYIFRYYIAIPNIRQMQGIKEHSLEIVWAKRPYAVDRSDITYFPNVFALAVL